MKNKRAKGRRNRRKAVEDNAGTRQTTPQLETPPPPQPQPATQPELSPLDYALALMRDEAQPVALRASMAKAAMPYLHQRAEGDAPPEDEPEPEPKPRWSDLEVARRIAHILLTADKKTGNPVEKPANAGHGAALGAKTT